MNVICPTCSTKTAVPAVKPRGPLSCKQCGEVLKVPNEVEADWEVVPEKPVKRVAPAKPRPTPTPPAHPPEELEPASYQSAANAAYLLSLASKVVGLLGIFACMAVTAISLDNKGRTGGIHNDSVTGLCFFVALGWGLMMLTVEVVYRFVEAVVDHARTVRAIHNEMVASRVGRPGQ